MTKYRTKELHTSTFGGVFYTSGGITSGGTTGTSNTYTSDTEFDTYDEAVKSAKRVAMERKEDVEIWAVDSIVRFPEPDLTVEKVSVST